MVPALRKINTFDNPFLYIFQSNTWFLSITQNKTKNENLDLTQTMTLYIENKTVNSKKKKKYIEVNLPDLGLGKELFDMTTEAQSIKAKMDK